MTAAILALRGAYSSAFRKTRTEAAATRPSEAGVTLELKFTAGRVFAVMCTLTTILVVLHLIGQLVKYYLGFDRGFATLFSLNDEMNVPTWYSSVGLLVAAVVLAAIAWAKLTVRDRFRFWWLGLAAVFTFMSLDETATIHERVSHLIEGYVHTSGAFYYAWVIPAGIGVLLMGLAYIPFVLHLPLKTRILVVVGGVMYVTGALNLELVEGVYTETHGLANLPFLVMTTVEESFEMLGVAIFVYALLDYIGSAQRGYRYVLNTRSK